MTTPTKPKATLVTDKAMVDLLTRRVHAFRTSPRASKDDYTYIRGRGSYALYGIDHARGQLVVLASEATSGDFNKYCTAKAKADACARYDQVVEYRDVGSASNPKVTILCWKAEDDKFAPVVVKKKPYPKRASTATVTEVVLPPAIRITLKRPVRPSLAQRLVELHPRLTALNVAGKTQKDAASALGTSVPLMRTWVDVLGIKWTNLQPRAPYSAR